MKTWIEQNLVINGKLVSKRCKKEWFDKYGFLDSYNKILSETRFLDDLNPTLPQRIWHIYNGVLEKFKCKNPACNNSTTFFAFTKGYLDTCSCECAQLNPETIATIKQTNLKKYGAEYTLQNKFVRQKGVDTVRKRYGVDNVSQVKEISEKKKRTCLKNYGVEWFLERQDIKEKIVNEKYHVNNVQSVKEISDKTAKTRRDDFWDSLPGSDRFHGRVELQCSKENYTGVGKKYDFKCLYCGNIFAYTLRWDRIPRCLNCYPSANTSLFEKEIKDFIVSLLPNVEVVENDRTTLISKKELDIYVPTKGFAIECDGLFWHGELNGGKDRNYHLSKLLEANNKNIKLIHIFEDEWSEKQEIVKSKLKHLLGLNVDTKIYARKCKIRALFPLEKKLFLEENHIQGNDVSSIQLGLFYNGELVAAMTFCKKRAFIGGDRGLVGEYELSRYAALKSCNVVGGAGKLLAYFIENHQPTKITSYADRRWSTGDLYEKLGFKKVSDGTPNYWYFSRSKDYRRHHRFAFAKHTQAKKLKVFNPELTEWENMKNNGWDRIWDCGNFKYEWKSR